MRIELHGVGKTYGRDRARVVALDGVDLVLETGRSVAVVGPSGCGKTTLLNVVGHVAAPDAGRVRIEGRTTAVPPRRRRGGGLSDSRGGAVLSDSRAARLRNATFGYLFQEFALIEEDTALENVQLPLYYSRPRPHRPERRRRALELLEGLDLARLAGRRVRDLSGGERQRVALARALATGAPFVLADEPTGALDTATSRQITHLLVDLARRGHGVVVVTHDPELAGACERVVQMRDGRIVA